MKHAAPEVLPPVRSRLSGLRATIREGKSTLVIQNNVKDKLYFRINNEDIAVDTNMFLGVLNNLLKKEENTSDEV